MTQCVKSDVNMVVHIHGLHPGCSPMCRSDHGVSVLVCQGRCIGLLTIQIKIFQPFHNLCWHSISRLPRKCFAYDTVTLFMGEFPNRVPCAFVFNSSTLVFFNNFLALVYFGSVCMKGEPICHLFNDKFVISMHCHCKLFALIDLVAVFFRGLVSTQVAESTGMICLFFWSGHAASFGA